jgi:hypothetical protein
MKSLITLLMGVSFLVNAVVANSTTSFFNYGDQLNIIITAQSARIARTYGVLTVQVPKNSSAMLYSNYPLFTKPLRGGAITYARFFKTSEVGPRVYFSSRLKHTGKSNVSTFVIGSPRVRGDKVIFPILRPDNLDEHLPPEGEYSFTSFIVEKPWDSLRDMAEGRINVSNNVKLAAFKVIDNLNTCSYSVFIGPGYGISDNGIFSPSSAEFLTKESYAYCADKVAIVIAKAVGSKQ